jgi:hypothetical protein
MTQAIAVLRAGQPTVDDQILHRVWGSEGYDDQHLDADELTTRVQRNVDWLLGALVDPGQEPEAIPGFEDVAGRAEEIGTRRALQGVGIDAVIASWRTAERLIEERLVTLSEDVDAHEVLAAVIKLRVLVGALTDRSVRAYRRVQQEVTSHYDRLTIDLVARIVSADGAAADEVRERAAVVGADAEADYAAVAVGFSSAADERAVLQSRRDILGVIGLRVQGRVLVGSIEDTSLLLVPTPSDAMPALVEVLRSAARRSTRPESGPVIGVAARAKRLASSHDAAHQARLAVEVGLRLRRYADVVPYQEVAVEALILRSPDTAALVADQLAPLRDRPELTDTLRAWLDCGQSGREAARRLFVHPNTVPHRLRTIELLLHRSLTSGESLLDLQLALRAIDLNRGS